MSQKQSLLSELKCAKEESNRLLASEEKTSKITGYESILIDFSLLNFDERLKHAYPEIVTGGDHPHINKRRFEKTFKKIFTENYLILVIKEKIEEDPERKNEKFAFEEKLKPFYSAIDQFRLRNQKIQYDLKI